MADLEGAVAPPPAEAVATPERITREQQTQEVRGLGQNALHRRVAEAATAYRNTPPDQRGSLDQGTRKLNSIATLGALSTTGEEYQGVERDNQGNTVTKKGIDMTKGNPVTVEATRPNGQKPETVKIIRIIKGSDTTFTCEMQTTDDSTGWTAEIPRSDVVNKQLAVEATAIMGQFQGTEQQVVQLYINLLQNGDQALEGKTPDEVNQLIEAAAKQAGVLTVDDIKAAVDKMLPEVKPADPAQQLTAEQQAQNARRTRMVEALSNSGKNIADQEVLGAVFNSEGFTPEQLAQQANQAQTRIAQAQARVNADPNNQEARQALAAAQSESALISMAREATRADGPMSTYLERMAKGDIPPEQGRAAVAAFREGNLIPLIEMAQPELTPNPTDTADQAAEKAAKKKALEDAAKKSGNIFLYLLAALVLSTQAVTESTKKFM